MRKTSRSISKSPLSIKTPVSICGEFPRALSEIFADVIMQLCRTSILSNAIHPKSECWLLCRAAALLHRDLLPLVPGNR